MSRHLARVQGRPTAAVLAARQETSPRRPHPAHLAFTGLLVLLAGLPLASRAGEPLIVVEDHGGTSALPYYEPLNLQPRANAPARPHPDAPGSRHASGRSRDAAGAQRKLTPGTVARRG